MPPHPASHDPTGTHKDESYHRYLTPR